MNQTIALFAYDAQYPRELTAMTYCLVDNSTLTAVQRVCGDAPVKNRDTIDGDLAAFETFIEALLFYDDLICIDDYKAQFQEQRAKRFPYIRFVDAEKHGLDVVAGQARQLAAQTLPSIQRGTFRDADISGFLETLKMNAICTWDMRSSLYYLTMKCLADPASAELDQFNKLSAAIFSELSDTRETTGRWSTVSELIGRDGTVYDDAFFSKQESDKAGVTRQLEMFVASLNWLAYKSIYYSLAAGYLKADTCLHPIRHGYQLNWMRKHGALNTDFSSKLIKSMSEELKTTTESILDYGRMQSLTLNLPIFSAWLLQQAGRPSLILNVALEMRSDPAISEVRELLKAIHKEFDADDVQAANRKIQNWESALRSSGDSLRRKFGIETAQGTPLSPWIKAYNYASDFFGGIKLPELDLKVDPPEFMHSPDRKAMGFLFKSISNDMMSFERMGNIRTRLAADFVKDKDFHEYGSFKAEEPKFLGRESHWKLNM